VEGAQDATRRKRFGGLQAFSLASRLFARFFLLHKFAEATTKV
jgi:hypothetical protein